MQMRLFLALLVAVCLAQEKSDYELALEGSNECTRNGGACKEELACDTPAKGGLCGNGAAFNIKCCFDKPWAPPVQEKKASDFPNAKWGIANGPPPPHMDPKHKSFWKRVDEGHARRNADFEERQKGAMREWSKMLKSKRAQEKQKVLQGWSKTQWNPEKKIEANFQKPE